MATDQVSNIQVNVEIIPERKTSVSQVISNIEIIPERKSHVSNILIMMEIIIPPDVCGPRIQVI